MQIDNSLARSLSSNISTCTFQHVIPTFKCNQCNYKSKQQHCYQKFKITKIQFWKQIKAHFVHALQMQVWILTGNLRSDCKRCMYDKSVFRTCPVMHVCSQRIQHILYMSFKCMYGKSTSSTFCTCPLQTLVYIHTLYQKHILYISIHSFPVRNSKCNHFLALQCPLKNARFIINQRKDRVLIQTRLQMLNYEYLTQILVIQQIYFNLAYIFNYQDQNKKNYIYFFFEKIK
eukprot:TRINITY_DN5322_c1_g2_i4.p1 TRINITY_DN5322_c1_g2~~TRINITY_DN5322_c1_g2_i4.p1  ORF type:complete len:231 (-),score=-25.19 TRINITY_DN5322_c1_g2_i4:51-743(-)